MRIAVFTSHPIQYSAPLWQALAARGDVDLRVFYFSRAALEPTFDHGFGKVVAWDIDLLTGYEHEFLPRRWPTSDPKDNTWKGLNSGLVQTLRQGWDAVFIAGWSHINNWTIARACKRLDIPCLVFSDVSILTAFDKSKLRLAVKRVVLPHFLQTVAGALAPGDHSRAFLERYGAPPERVFFVPQPVDGERFRRRFEQAGPAALADVRRKYGIPDGKRVVTFSGKLVDGKRPQDLCEAMRRLERDDAMALLIGDGSLRKEIESRGYKNVILAGFVNQNDIPLLVGLGRVSVMPSSYDNHPQSVTESLCLGVPVILSDRAGCYGPNDVFRDGENGLLYRCGDVDALADRLRRLLSDDELYARMSRRARELAETQSPAMAAQALVTAARASQAFRRVRPAVAVSGLENPCMSSVTTYRDFVGERTFVQTLKESAREAAVCALSPSKSLSRNKGCIRFPFYHHVFDDERRGFERQLDVMKRHGDFLCLDDAIRLLEDGRQIDGCYFCLSFDDGLKNTVTNALPILAERGTPAAAFLPTDYIGTTLRMDPASELLVEYLDWEDCRKLAYNGFTIGSHTVSHVRLSALDRSGVEAELSESKAVIERELGRECSHLCCPWGKPGVDFLPDRDPALARELGYRSFLTTQRGGMRTGGSPYDVSRDHVLASWRVSQVHYFLGM